MSRSERYPLPSHLCDGQEAQTNQRYVRNKLIEKYGRYMVAAIHQLLEFSILSFVLNFRLPPTLKLELDKGLLLQQL